MKFFEAQKKLVKIWFVWISLLMIFVTYHVLKGKYVHVANEIMEFVKFFKSGILEQVGWQISLYILAIISGFATTVLSSFCFIIRNMYLL